MLRWCPCPLHRWNPLDTVYTLIMRVEVIWLGYNPLITTKNLCKCDMTASNWNSRCLPAKIAMEYPQLEHMGMFHCHSGPGRWSSKNPVPLAQFILLQGSVKLFGFRQGGKSNDPDKTLLHRLHLNDATVNGYQQNLLGSKWNRCHHQYIPQGYEYRPT
jgi:hypothetical protein